MRLIMMPSLLKNLGLHFCMEWVLIRTNLKRRGILLLVYYTLASKQDNIIRPKRLGLGADPQVMKLLDQKKNSKNKESKEELKYKVGAKVQIEGLDGDTGRVAVRMTLSKEVSSLLEHALRLVTEDEYNHLSKYLNQMEAEEFKKKDQVRLEEERRKDLEMRLQYAADQEAQLTDNNDFVKPYLPSECVKPHNF
ncbi:unnamed protein product [Protopolystoma xenopodis]|uniref:Uncharacterized protein n=1 Tax=Protopolystoma xenopodis TaxID=117903 RepID=A0A448WTH4_9PLAT|nr:unnamed protein product [Protopolystoma xenopodis]